MPREGFDVSAHFGAVAHRYDEVFTGAVGLEDISRLESTCVLSRLGDIRGRTVLDAGMGTGRMARQLLDAGASVIGVDLTREMLLQSSGRSPEAAPVVARVGDALPFRDGSFDDVICVRVLKYFEEWSETFAEFRRLMRPGGRLVIEMANRRSIARWGYRDLPISFATVEQTHGLLRAAGFNPIGLDAGKRLPYPLYARAGIRGARALRGAEAVAGRLLGRSALARSFFVTAELPV